MYAATLCVCVSLNLKQYSIEKEKRNLIGNRFVFWIFLKSCKMHESLKRYRNAWNRLIKLFKYQKILGMIIYTQNDIRY